MASIKVVQDAVMICREAGVSLMIWGKHGIGKSSIVQDLAYKNGLGLVNLRLSQIEAADIRGLPYRDENNRTQYAPPADLPIGDITFEQAKEMIINEKDKNKQNALFEHLQPRMENGILFLDESFRAQDDVQQAVFELVLDRKAGQYVLPLGWSIVCANNFFEGYLTNGFNDPAFLDRFCHIILSGDGSTHDEWIEYMAKKHGDSAMEIIEFCTQSETNLDPVIKTDLGFQILPSRRAWDAVVRVVDACNRIDADDESKLEVIAGLVGREMAIQFGRVQCPIKPRDIVNHGVKHHEDVMRGFNRNQHLSLTWGLQTLVGSFIGNEENKDKDKEKVKYYTIVLDFAEWMIKNTKEHDLITGFLTYLVSIGVNNKRNTTQKSALSNPKIAKLINNAERKMGKNNTLLQMLEERPELSKLIAKTSYGRGDDDE